MCDISRFLLVLIESSKNSTHANEWYNQKNQYTGLIDPACNWPPHALNMSIWVWTNHSLLAPKSTTALVVCFVSAFRWVSYQHQNTGIGWLIHFHSNSIECIFLKSISHFSQVNSAFVSKRLSQELQKWTLSIKTYHISFNPMNKSWSWKKKRRDHNKKQNKQDSNVIVNRTDYDESYRAPTTPLTPPFHMHTSEKAWK